jgi:hypothetical protein
MFLFTASGETDAKQHGCESSHESSHGLLPLKGFGLQIRQGWKRDSVGNSDASHIHFQTGTRCITQNDFRGRLMEFSAAVASSVVARINAELVKQVPKGSQHDQGKDLHAISQCQALGIKNAFYKWRRAASLSWPTAGTRGSCDVSWNHYNCLY